MNKHHEWLVLLIVAVALLLGGITKQKALHQVQVIQWQKNQIEVPAHWTITSQDQDLFVAADLDQGQFGPKLTMQRISLQAGSDLRNVANNWALKQTKQYSDHRVLSISEASVQGKAGIKMDCVYLQDIGPNLIPGLMRSTEVLVPIQNEIYIWIFAAKESEFENLEKLQTRLLEKWIPA